MHTSGQARSVALSKAASLFAVLLIGAGLAGAVVYLRRDVVPPDCRDPRTLALVRESLTQRFALPASVRMEAITMLAGGPLAFRFVCEADLRLPEGAPMPPGAKPGFARYTSALVADGTRHEVTVEVLPLLLWQKAQ